jgi:hypothetical protein
MLFHPQLDKRSVDSFAYVRSSPGVPALPEHALEPEVENLAKPEEPHVTAIVPEGAYTPTAPNAYSALMMMRHDVVDDSHMIMDLQKQQQALVTQESSLMDQIANFHALPGPMGPDGPQGPMGKCIIYSCD